MSLVVCHNQHIGDIDFSYWSSEWVFLFQVCPCVVCTLSLGPASSSWRSSVVSVSAADVIQPNGVGSKQLGLFDWLELNGASQRLEESAQKMLAETVCFHVEDFGEARSFLQSLKEKDGGASESHFYKDNLCMSFSKYLKVYFLSFYILLLAVCIWMCKITYVS